MWITVNELAQHENVTESTIRTRIYHLEYDALRIGNDWRIWVDDLVGIDPMQKTKRSLAKAKEAYFYEK